MTVGTTKDQKSTSEWSPGNVSDSVLDLWVGNQPVHCDVLVTVTPSLLSVLPFKGSSDTYGTPSGGGGRVFFVEKER